MHDDMYSIIDRQKPKEKADRSIALVVAIVLVIMLGILAIFGRMFYQRFEFRSFTSAMSEGTSAGGLRSECDGEVALVTVEHAYSLYQLFTQNPGKERKEIPVGEPVFLLNYNNGSVMECWEVPLEQHVQRQKGICWRFTTSDGTVWIYDSADFGYNDIWRLVNADANKRLHLPN